MHSFNVIIIIHYLILSISVSKFERPNPEARRPPVPKKDEKPVMGLNSNKNFIHTNAVENIMSVAKKPTPKYVDKPSGTTNNLEVRKYIVQISATIFW